MTDEKRTYLYYLLDFDFIRRDVDLAPLIRDRLYKGIDYDDIRLYNQISKIKQISNTDELLTLTQLMRNKKISEILEN